MAVQRSIAWLAAPVAAACVVAWAASLTLGQVPTGVRALAVAGLFTGSGVLAITPGVALISVVARRRQLGRATGLGLLFAGAGLAGMAAFWAWFASPPAGRAFAAALLVASVAAIAVFGRRGDLRRLELPVPLLLALVVGLLLTSIAFLQGGIAARQPWGAIDIRYWLAADNDIPLLFASRVAAHQPLSGYLVDSWLSSDRPPLQTGLVLLQWPLWGHGRQLAYQLLSSGLQSSWLPAVWVVLRVRGLPVRRVCAVVVSTAATGVVFFNTVYVWPKMLAGGLALAALAILVSRDDRDRQAGAGVLAMVLVTLSMLAHGGTAFAVIALAPFGYLLRRRITVRAVAACAGAALAIYLPWTAYQRFVDPPGNRLLKWQLAGVIPVDKRGFLQTLVQQYRSLTLHELVANKWVNLMSLVANPTEWHTQTADPAWASGFMGFARLAQINDLVPAAGPLLLGVVALLIPSARRRLAAVKPLAACTGLAVAVWVVLLWGGQQVPAINHQGAYAATVLFVALCAVAVTALPRLLAGAVMAANAGWFVVSWLPGLGFHPAASHASATQPVDPAVAVVFVAAFAALAALCAVTVLPAAGPAPASPATEAAARPPSTSDVRGEPVAECRARSEE